MINYQTPISIQDNMDFLAYLMENHPDHEVIINQARDVIQWFGVQPDLETISFDDKDAIMLFWDTPKEDYLAMYLDGSDIAIVEEPDFMGEPHTRPMPVKEVIEYYNKHWHAGLFAYEQEMLENENNY